MKNVRKAAAARKPVPFLCGITGSISTADKKRTDDVTKFIVPERVGHCRVEPVPTDEVAGWLKAGGLR